MASGYSKLGTQEALNDMYVVLDRAAYNQGVNAKYDIEVKIGGGDATSNSERSGSGVLLERRK